MATGYAAEPRIEVDGTPLPLEYQSLLERVVVDEHAFLPEMFVLRFRDADQEVIRGAGFGIGAQVKIMVTPLGEDSAAALISGEVTALEAELDVVSGSHAVVRGYDHSHRLHRGRTTATYRNVTDSDIARLVARRAGLPTGRIDETTTTHRLVSQANQSDWAFLRARATEIGCDLTMSDGKLEFRRPADASSAPASGDLTSTDPLQLVIGADLLAFRPRVTSAEQVTEVQVRGWDPDHQQVLTANVAAATSSVALPLDPAQLADRFGGPVHVATDRPWSTQGEVDAAASALAERIASAFAQADGTATGNPKLRAGVAVSVGLAGDPFEGNYTITSTRHVFDREGFRTHFSVTGRHLRSLLSLAAGPEADQHIPGVVIAKVTSTADPGDQGRVKVAFPWLSDSYESDWVRVVQAGAGPERGFVVVPETDDEVLVAFELGDVHRPYVLGGLYNGVAKPMLGEAFVDASTGEVRRRGFVSKHGHALVFLDDDDQDGIALLTGDQGLRISLNHSQTRIKVSSRGDVVIEADGDVSITGRQLTLAADAGVSIDGGRGNVTVKGTQVRLN